MTVFLVGAGPGDPELLTLRGANLLARAEVVIHDRLATPVLALASKHAELVNVGKAPGSTPVPQHQINRLLVDYGRRFGHVVRLKGGDPFVFARGAEEIDALIAADVPFEVVPGISSALAAPAAAGIPLTLRNQVRMFTVLTGHDDPDAVPDDQWQALATLGGTIVVMMGSKWITSIATKLIGAGLAPDTPVTGVHAATTSDQIVQRSTLDAVTSHRSHLPVIFIIGEVAGLDLTAQPLTRIPDRTALHRLRVLEGFAD